MPSFPCPCCGYLVFDEPGAYDLCPLCFWEDDGIQLEFATTCAGGANGVTLLEAQRNFAAFGACEERARAHVRAPSSSDIRDPSWRPIDPERDHFEDWDDDGKVRASDETVESLYYWRDRFWRRAKH